MGACLVIVLSPCFDFELRIGQRQEPVRVQTLGAEAPVKRLDLGVIGRFAWTREVQLDTVLIRPAVHRLGNEFAAVVGLDRRGFAARIAWALLRRGSEYEVNHRSQLSAG